MNPQSTLIGKVTLVTGSTTGLGLEIARELARRGATVALNFAHNETRAQQAYDAFLESGFAGELFQADVCDEKSINELIGSIKTKLGPVDILVPNATGPQPQRPIEAYTWEIYQEMIDFFIKSPFLLAQAVLPQMKSKSWGRIVNIGTEAVETAMPNFSPYVAAKGGQKGWTHSMATELAPFGITVNMVSPGWIPTERHQDCSQEDLDEYEQTIPMGRWGEASEVAHTVAYLCESGASFVTGQTICVNGGRSAL